VDGFRWLRLGSIFALLIGSLYVLLPTILQEDPHAALEETASEVTVTRKGSPEMQLKFSIVEGHSEDLVPAVQKRLGAAGLDIRRVQARQGRVIVTIESGEQPDRVYAEMERSPVTISLFDLAALATLPEPLPETLTEVAALDVVAALTDTEPVAGASALTTSLEWDGAKLKFDGEAPTGIVAIINEGKIKALARLGLGVEIVPLAVGFDVGSHVGNKLPGILERVDTEGGLVISSGADEDAEGSKLPEWVIGILPDTRMPLGLDLQGGIDLTLQVQLDEALLSQANRDKQYLENAAEREGIEITYTKRDVSEPVLWIESPAGAGELTSLFAKRVQGYEYLETVTEGGRTLHGFGMQSDAIDRVQTQAMDQVLDQLRKRVAETRVRDPVVVRKGGGRVSVQLPGMTDIATAVETLGTVAVLEFRLVDTEFSQEQLYRILREAEDAMPTEQFEHEPTLNDWLWRKGKLPENRIVLFEFEDTMVDGVATEEKLRPVIMKNTILLTGNDVSGANVSFNPNTQEPYVTMDFKPQGGNVFCTVTSENVGKPFAIILDSKVKSTPNIQERICNGSARITLNNDMNATQEANILATVLRTGSLNAPVDVGQVRVVGPSLGADAIRAGSIATLIGGSLVLVFMAVWYGRAGLIANFALVLNVMLMLAGLSVFGWTLTLPGIAGIALTNGMAVDANIIIYERIREELKLCQNARKAVETGFEKAAVAVIDANATTAIAGVVLFSYGNVTIQGFAVTLLIGIGTTLITALFVTRSLLEVVTRNSTARLRL
jgi:preprotein translocase subunit SecD